MDERGHPLHQHERRVRQFVEPVGKLSDSRREHYELHLPVNPDGKPSEHLITVRVYDRHDNVGVAKTVFTSPTAISTPAK